MNEIRLPDLEVIRRFSIAVRSEHAAAEDVLEALRADVASVEKSMRRRRTTRTTKRKPARAARARRRR